jgi:hypothetical protein
MQDNTLIQPMLQPFFKLAQSNMALLTQVSFSPEVVQGLMKNYTEFLMELGQGGMAMLSQGQAAFLRNAQEASSNVFDATPARRTRQAA